MMMPQKFNHQFFDENIDLFRDLRNFLKRHHYVNLNDLEVCGKVISSTFRFYPDETVDLLEAYKSLGTFIKCYGGIREFLKKPVIEILPSVSALAFIDLINAKEIYEFSVINMPDQRYFDLANAWHNLGLRANEVDVDSHFITRYLKEVSSRPVGQIDAALDMHLEQFPEPLADDVEESVRSAFTIFIVQMVNKMNDDSKPDDHVVPHIDLD